MIRIIRFFIVALVTMQYFDYGIVIAQESKPENDTSETMSHVNIIEQLLNFSESSLDVDCVLPCFSDFRPDETVFSEIRERLLNLFSGDDSIFSRLNTPTNPFERDDGLLGYSLRFNFYPTNGSYTLSFIISPEENVLRRFYTRLNQPANWIESHNLSISETLTALGTPDEVYISISGAQPPYFDIVLDYETRGTLFLYSYYFEPEQLTQGSEPIPLCGSWSSLTFVDIWIQSVDKEFYESLLDETIRNFQQFGDIEYSTYRSLIEMTNWSVDDWTQFLSETPEWCFDSLSYNELLESGYSY